MLLSLQKSCLVEMEMLGKGERIYYQALGALICCRCFSLFTQAMPVSSPGGPTIFVCMCDRERNRRTERKEDIFFNMQRDYTISTTLSNHQKCQDKDKKNMYLMTSSHQSYQTQDHRRTAAIQENCAVSMPNFHITDYRPLILALEEAFI